MSENAEDHLKMALFIVPEDGSEKIFTFQHAEEKFQTIIALHKTTTTNVEGGIA